MKFESADWNRDRPRLVCLILSLVTLLAYLPACFHDFIALDDPTYVSQNEMVQRGLTWAGLKWAFTTETESNWHPLTWMSHMLDCECFGLNTRAHHLMNVLFHIANVVLLFQLWFRMTRALWSSAFVAALFAWHPLHVESVAWVAERKDVLSTFFALLTLTAYVRYAAKVQSPKSKVRNPTRGLPASLDLGPWTLDYIVALVFFVLGLLAKPMLVTLPFLLLLLDFWPLKRAPSLGCQAPGERHGKSPPTPRTTHLAPLLLEKWPFFLLSAASCVVTFLVQSGVALVPVSKYPIDLRCANALISCIRYLKNTVWPTNLAIVYPLHQYWPAWQVSAAAAILLAITLLAWLARRRSPCLLMGWLWFLGTLIPVIGLVQVGAQAMADRYTYIPLIGVFVAVSYGISNLAARFHPKTLVLSTAAGVVLCACLIATECQLRFWRDTESLFTRALAVTKDNGGAHLVLAGYFAGQHRLKEAAVQFREALRLDRSPFIHTHLDQQNNARSRLSLAQVFESQDCDQEALTEYQEALRLDPTSVEGHNNLGNLLDKMGRADEALTHYLEAVRLDPNAPLARDNLGTLLVKLGRFDEAMEQYAEAVRLQPDDPRPHYLMGKAWLRRGQSTEAIQQLREALRLDPNDFRTLTCLARVLAADRNLQVRDGTEAVRLAERANALTGATQPFVLDTLAMAYAETGRFTEAQKTLVTAIGILESAGARHLISEMQQRLECYRSGQPYRESFTNALFLPETNTGHSQK